MTPRTVYLLVGKTGRHEGDYSEWLVRIYADPNHANIDRARLQAIADEIHATVGKRDWEARRLAVTERLLPLDPRAEMEDSGTRYSVEPQPLIEGEPTP